MKNNLPWAVFVTSGIMLTACAQLTNLSEPAGNQNEQCLQMQRERVFHANDLNQDATMLTREQQQAYTARYNTLCK